GTATAPITLMAQNKWGAILDCQLPYGYAGDGTDGVQACDANIDFQGTASYITVKDFDITGAYWDGANVNGSDNHNIQFIGNHLHHIGNRHYVVPPGTSSYGIEGVFAGTASSNIVWDRNEFNNIGRLPTPGQTDDYSHDHGIYIFKGPYTITNNIFYANTAGWGVQVSPGTHDTVITNNTFQGANPAQNGLIVLWGEIANPNTNITIQNNIFYGSRNYAIGAIQAYEAGTLIDHNIVYGSPSGVIDTSAVIGTLTLTNNRINTDPMFVGLTTDDFHLQAGSPAIDTGASVMVAADFDGNPRPLGAAFDLGAYEYGGGTTLTAPSGLAATAISGTEIDLTWTNNSPAATAMLVEDSTNNV